MEEKSEDIRKRVNEARKVQLKRFEGTTTNCNAKMTSNQVNKYCALSDECEKLIKDAFEKLNLSARAYNRILKVARTIADLDFSENIELRLVIVL